MRYLLLLAGMVSVMLQAQTTTQNYIVTTVPTQAVSNPTTLTDANSNTTIGYFDGLGRPSQTVQKAITPSGADLVSGIVYDPYGRESQRWLPAPATTGTGAFLDTTNFGNAATGQYGSGEKPYSTTEYEPSPLNRVTGQYGAGADWYTNGKKKVITYIANASDVKLFYTENNVLKCNGTYGAATLYGQRTTDEDGKWVEEYTDKLGRKVLSRVAGDHDTYYVYDDLDNLHYVIPPKAADLLGTNTTGFDESTGSILDFYGYIYHYDGRKRCIEKKLPGCTYIYMVYDKADRLILSQDGNQRLKKQWTVNKYDAFGRLVYSGLLYSNNTRSTMESNYSGSVTNESFTSSSSYGGYSCSAPMPVRLLTVNYYDTYTFRKLQTAISDTTKLVYTTLSGYDTYFANAKTLLTGTRIYHLDDSTKYEATALYYDKYGRVVQTRASNHLGGYDITYNALDFSGKPMATLKTHGISGASDTYKEYYTYTYDKAQRLTSTTHKLGDSGSPVTLASNSYDPLGRLQTKTLGGVDATTYNYNVRSWISGISGSRFTENLYYNQNTASLPNFTASYNGNISGIQWSIPGENLTYTHTYSFMYDNLNRFTYTVYFRKKGSQFSNIGRYDEGFTYDKMGNVNSLFRFENGSLINDLSFAYTGNQLLSVYDALSVTKLYGSEAFDNKANLSTEYIYDANGSTTYDANSGISTIQYNVLNLPDQIQFTEGHKNLYTYDAGGKKLRLNNYTLHNPINVPQGNISSLPANSSDYTQTVTDYVGNMIYENGSLKEILLPEGYWQSGVYYYNLKDHLGDNRVTINSSGTVIEKSHYYPSGMRFAPVSSSNSATLPYRYNGKELETMNGLNQYDYGARRRGAGLPIWTGVDPLCEKKPWMSPYAYCSDNPMSRIDPDGKDDYYVNQKGQIVRIEHNEKADNFYRVNNKGLRMQGKGNSLTFKHNTVKFIHPAGEKEYGKRDPKSGTIDIFNVKGDSNADKIFKFTAGSKQADGTTKQTVEWGKYHLTTNSTNSPYDNIVSTGNNNGHELSFPTVYRIIQVSEDKIRDYSHNHPSGDLRPSDADLTDFNKIRHENNYKATFHIVDENTDHEETF